MPSTIQSTDSVVELKSEAVIPPGFRALGACFSEFLSPHLLLDTARRRSMDRYRRITFTAFTSLGSKAIGLITAVIVVPLTFRYLGPERYGLWMTMTSFVLFLGFADLGLGNGLTARIAEADGDDDHHRIARLVSCAFYSLLSLSILLFAAFAVVARAINWKSLYGLQTVFATHEAGVATAILVICSLANMPLGTVLRVQIGLQQGFVADLWNACGSLLALAGILLVVHYGNGLPALVLAVAGMPLLVTLCNWLVQFFYVRPTLLPRPQLFDSKVARQLLAVGGIFFLQQCFGLIYYLSDNLVIARTMGAVQVAHYAVIQRIFSIGLITQYLVAPLWPALGEALARQDLHWASRAAGRALIATFFVSTFCALPLLVTSRYLVTRWSGLDPGPIDMLRIGFAVWVVLVGYIATMNALLNQERVIRRHLAIFGTASIVSLILKIIFATHGSVAGVIWATNIGFGVIYVVPTLLLARRSLYPKSLEVYP